MRILYNSDGKSGEPITIENSNTLTDGSFIFSHTQSKNLNIIDLNSLDNAIDLSSLESGVGMFWNSNLSTYTLKEIARTIKPHPDGETHIIDLGNIDLSNTEVSIAVADVIEKEKKWTVKSVEIQGEEKYKYAGCLTIKDVKTVDANYKTTDVVNGVWNEWLGDLKEGGNGHAYGGMFYMCTALTSFTSDLPSLTFGYEMFRDCSQLESFSSDLSSLTNGTCMFNYCKNLESFSSDLSSLTNGTAMFQYCSDKLTSFNVDLPSLTDGSSMFIHCDKLTSFTSDLSSLTNGSAMFRYCSQLISFNSDLPSLTNGYYMFKGCNLSVDSIERIANSLPFQFDSEIHIGNLGESISSSVTEACNLMSLKGWTVKHGDDDKVYTNQWYVPSNKYDGCKNKDEVEGKNSNYGRDVTNGFWIHPLKDLENGISLFSGNRSINNFCADLSSLKYGGRMFYSINGADAGSLINFCSSMPNLIDGESMFGCDTKLKSFKGGLKSLTNGFEMFYDCTALTVINEDLTTLTNGAAMFRNCTSLSELNFNLQSMVDGTSMFYVDTASYTSFKGDLSKLVQGHSMFKNRLRSFDANLSSLEIGKDMFKNCCLDKKSVKKIASTIKLLPAKILPENKLPENFSWTKPAEYYTAQNYAYDQAWWKESWDDSNRGIITLGIDSRLEDDNELQNYLAQIIAKNWIVEVEYNEIDSKIKYIDCLTVEDIEEEAGSNYLTNDIVNGIWSEPLPKLQYGRYQDSSLSSSAGMFESCANLTTFNSDLSSLVDGHRMFYGCNKLTTFNSDLSSLIYAYQMFDSCEELTTFTSDLRYLKYGYWMFASCNNLTTFNCDTLRYLTTAAEMFYGCNNLKSFNSNLSSLTDGHRMFASCNNLTTFNSDLSSLVGGYGMFASCNNLTTFNSDLSSLKSGYQMFIGCELDAPSVQNIANTINDISKLNRDNNVDWTYCTLIDVQAEMVIEKSARGRIDIGHADDVSQEVLQYCGNKLIDKGWDVYFNDTLYEYTSLYDVSEANGYCPDAYKNGTDSWNTLVLTPNMDVLKISIVNEKGEMLNDE